MWLRPSARRIHRRGWCRPQGLAGSGRGKAAAKKSRRNASR
jgi:hypothetical protein